VFALQINHRAAPFTPNITFLVVIQLLVSRIERDTTDLAGLLFGFVSLAIRSTLAIFLFPHFPVPRFPAPRFLLPRF